MKTDLLLVPMGTSYAAMRAAAVAAEEAGFDGIWTWDHLRDPGGDPAGVPEAWTVLSALAEATHRVMLGPLVLNVSNRDPGLLANMAATLQQVSGGRLLLGLGAGGHRRLPYAAEQEMRDIAVEPDARRAGRVAEAIQVMRRLWTGEAGSFDGEHYRLHRPTGFLRAQPTPPVIVGGFGPRMAGIAGRHGDGFNTQARSPQLRELLEVARREHAVSGRTPERFVATVFAGLDSAWLRPDSPGRQRLEALDVDRVILLTQPPYDPGEIHAAGRLLAPPGG